MSAIFAWINCVIRSHFRGLKYGLCPYFFYYACFACFEGLVSQILNLQANSHVIRRCEEAMWIKEAYKGGPKWPNIGKIRGPNRSTKRVQNATLKKQTDREGQSPPRPVVGGARPCVPCAAWDFSVFFVPLHFPTRFSDFCLYNRMYLDTLSRPNSFPFIHHFHL